MEEEPKIKIGDREELLVMLSEAAAIEHNVMCCYLYGIWSVKNGEQEGLTADQAKVVAEWKDLMLGVAVEEMGHLAQVGNLTASIGGTPFLTRPNFPIPAAFHPAAIDLELVGFSDALLEHAIYLERPEGMQMHDAPEFVHPDHYDRTLPKDRIMPTTQDYETIGHLYRGIYHGFEVLTRRYGEQNLFCGEPQGQLGPSDSGLPEICVVTDLASAHKAIETIVEQGEGAPGHSTDSHYARFIAVRTQLEQMSREDPSFAPAYPVARNPAIRKPAGEHDRVWITDPEASRVLDVANSLYGIMLRLLSQSYGRTADEAEQKSLFVQLARRIMSPLTTVCEYLASLPAGPEHPGVNAGMSFTMSREFSRLPTGGSEMRFLGERMLEIAAHAERIFADGHPLEDIGRAVRAMAAPLAVPDAKAKVPPPDAERGHPGPKTMQEETTQEETTQEGADEDVSSAESDDLTLHFNTRRCVHSRNCVLSAPEVFLANVEGDWLFPKKMDGVDLRGVCMNCPSGAITFEPKGDLAAEPAPQVNTVHLRENGPYAFRATLVIDGQREGFRATLCRCGASKNKPFCDNSHKRIGFHATGEPETRPSDPLAARGGALRIDPEHNGPLVVTGNLEICAGTGRTIDRVTGARLCRCGGSKTKPFCDNTHRKIGFKSD